jgi:adenosylhomocysteinase
MVRVQNALASLPDLRTARLAMSIHLDLKMILLVEGLLKQGAQLYLITCNPSTVRDEVVAYMRRLGAEAQA